MIDTNELYRLQQLQKGSLKAFDALYVQYSGKLYNFILSISNNNIYLSEEIVQRTFIKVWETREQINTGKSFIAYLYTIARNMLVNFYQHQLVEYVYKNFVQTECGEGHSETEQEIEYNLLVELVDSIVEKLPEGRKKVYRLSKKEHMQNKEIAQELGIAESTVEKQLAAALKFVREQLSKHYDTLVMILWIVNMLK